jgi:hypothetical protein
MAPNRRSRFSLFSLLLLLAPALALGVLMRSVLDLSRSAHEKDDEHLKVTTDLVASSLEKYLSREAGSAVALTRAPGIADEVMRLGTRKYDKDEVRKLDESWRAGEATIDDRVLEGKLSDFLKSFTGSPESPYRELLVADDQGRLIAASNRTEDYDQADDSWWPALQTSEDRAKFEKQCASSIFDCISVADVDFDPSADVTAFAVVVPILSEGRVKGVMKAVVDTTTLEALMKLVYSNVALKGRLLGRDGQDVLDPSFMPTEKVQQAAMGLRAGQEWDSGDDHLRRSESRFQSQPWTIYITNHADGVTPSAERGTMLLLFAVVMVLVTGIGAALAFPGRLPRWLSASHS